MAMVFTFVMCPASKLMIILLEQKPIAIAPKTAYDALHYL